MMLSRFFQWVAGADARQRAEACGLWAQAACAPDTPPAERRDLETILAFCADDASPLVRVALAEALADARSAPRAVVVALAHDQPSVAAPVLARSPVLTEADLVEAARVGGAAVESALLDRPLVPAALAALLADRAADAVLPRLARHSGAVLTAATLRRLVARSAGHPALREALGERRDLPADLRADLVAATAETLAAWTTRCGWLSAARAERVAGEAQDAATLTIAAGLPQRTERAAFVADLRGKGRVTARFLLRALLSRHRATAEAILADLSGLPAGRVAVLAAAPHSAGFAALFRKTGLPADLLGPVRVALDGGAEDGHGFDRQTLRRVLTACPRESGAATATLRRFEAEAAKQDARRHALPAPRRAARRPIQIDLAAIEAHLLAA